ncbi:hypothetical protein [Pedobacter sp. Hv1]|uniref:hypothetical protein n=1 Tax=Pedobacter sp. Hv1 TaxID=1740090 RepID=UPI0006D8BEBF|nr:hypothetical protein [Pedobacter sp. Hv1]KQC02008.1 hypothetical protein AQF98_00075 [Pedobacter sp. Hv1]
MKNVVILMLIAIVIFGCKKKKITPQEPATETIFPNLVNGIPDKHKVLLIDEDFNSNNNAWRIFFEPNNYYDYMKIEKGYYSFYNNGSGYMLNHSNGFNFDQSKDFEIETKLNATTKKYGLWWASNDLAHPYYGSYRLEFKEGKMDFVDGSTTFGEVYVVREKTVESTTNAVIKIRKIKNKYFFFLNQTLVYEGPYLPSKGQSIGFSFMGKGNFDADYLRISRLDI